MIKLFSTYVLNNLHAVGPYVTLELVINPFNLYIVLPSVIPNPMTTQFKDFPSENSSGWPDKLI